MVACQSRCVNRKPGIPAGFGPSWPFLIVAALVSVATAGIMLIPAVWVPTQLSAIQEPGLRTMLLSVTKGLVLVIAILQPVWLDRWRVAVFYRWKRQGYAGYCTLVLRDIAIVSFGLIGYGAMLWLISVVAGSA